MKKQTHYEVLGISETATEKKIKSAYRKKALAVHPDKNPSAELKEFHNVQMAYEVLSDPEKKKRYDFELKEFDSSDGFDVEAPDFFQKPSQYFLKSLPEIIERYEKRLNKKDRDLSEVLFDQQFLETVENRIDKEILNAISSNKIDTFSENRKLTDSFRALSAKYKKMVLLKIRSEMLTVQSHIQTYLSDALDQNKEKKSLLGEKPYNIPSYSDGRLYDILILNAESTNWCLKNQIAIEAIKSSPLGRYVSIKNPSKRYDPIIITLKPDYFLIKSAELVQFGLPKNASDQARRVAPSIQKLLEYIKERGQKEKYTGSIFGYSRERKIDAAQALYDALRKGNFENVISKMDKKNLKVLNQGSLKKIFKEVETRLKEEDNPKNEVKTKNFKR